MAMPVERHMRWLKLQAAASEVLAEDGGLWPDEKRTLNDLLTLCRKRLLT